MHLRCAHKYVHIYTQRKWSLQLDPKCKEKGCCLQFSQFSRFPPGMFAGLKATCTNNPALFIRHQLLLYYLCVFCSYWTANHSARASNFRRSGDGNRFEFGLPERPADLSTERQETTTAAASGSRWGEPQSHCLSGTLPSSPFRLKINTFMNIFHPISFQVSCTIRSTNKKRTIPIIVRVSDINDNAPRFMNTPYEVTVPEVSK